MNWTYTKLVIATLVFVILSGYSFTISFAAMGFAFAVCAGLMFCATFMAYLGNHIPVDHS